MYTDFVFVYKNLRHTVRAVEFYVTNAVRLAKLFAVNALAFIIVLGALTVRSVPSMRQRYDALHALFFKLPIAVDVDFSQNIFLPIQPQLF